MDNEAAEDLIRQTKIKLKEILQLRENGSPSAQGVITDFLIAVEVASDDGDTYVTHLRDFHNGVWRSLGLLEYTSACLRDSFDILDIDETIDDGEE